MGAYNGFTSGQDQLIVAQKPFLPPLENLEDKQADNVSLYRHSICPESSWHALAYIPSAQPNLRQAHRPIIDII